MRRISRFHPLLSILFLLSAAASTRADEPLHVRIDSLVAAGHPNYTQVAAPIAGDAEFLRRVTLDLTGTIPTSTEARNFLKDSSPTKRSGLITKLLASPSYARHMQQYFDVMLMDRRKGAKVKEADWEAYLLQSFAENKPLNELVCEILSNDGADPKTRASAKFLLDRDLEPTIVTRDISRLFLGQNLQCAQCHDHPLVDDYKQAQFYGIQAFFNRAYLFPNEKAADAVIAEKAEGEMNFVSVFDPKKVQKTTLPKVLEWKPVSDAKLPKGKEYKVKPAKNVKPVPAYSRFAQLGEAITGKGNPQFARAMANRLWAMMMGRGLVHPLDFDHSANPPSHPELLDLLAREFVAHKYDVRWLLGELASSKTYQRSSAIPATMKEVPEDRFLVAIMKPLSPEQLATATLQATGFTDTIRASLKKPTEAAIHAKLVPTLRAYTRTYGGEPGAVADEFVSTLDQTLFAKHNATVQSLIPRRKGNLLDRLVPLTDEAALTDELYLSLYSRLPVAEERKEITGLLGADPKTREVILTEMIWAMLNSTEFRFNH